MDNCITMIKYQGLGNDYLVLDPNKNRVTTSGQENRTAVPARLWTWRRRYSLRTD